MRIGAIGIMAVMFMIAAISVETASASSHYTLQLSALDGHTIEATYDKISKQHQYRIRYAHYEGASTKDNPWTYKSGTWFPSASQGTHTVATFTGLVPNTVYEVQLRSQSFHGTWSGWTALKYIRTMHGFHCSGSSPTACDDYTPPAQSPPVAFDDLEAEVAIPRSSLTSTQATEPVRVISPRAPSAPSETHYDSNGEPKGKRNFKMCSRGGLCNG